MKLPTSIIAQRLLDHRREATLELIMAGLVAVDDRASTLLGEDRMLCDKCGFKKTKRHDPDCVARMVGKEMRARTRRVLRGEEQRSIICNPKPTWPVTKS